MSRPVDIGICVDCGVRGYRVGSERFHAMPHNENHEPRNAEHPLILEPCTGVAASWCPAHGDCTCPEVGDRGERDMSGDFACTCPLHTMTSDHAEPAQPVAREITWNVEPERNSGRWPAQPPVNVPRCTTCDNRGEIVVTGEGTHAARRLPCPMCREARP